MSTEERFNLERQYHDQEGHVARLAGRLKFTCCRQCGSVDGMKSVHCETLAEIIETASPVSWYKEPHNAEYLFYPCPQCNHWRNIPNGYAHVAPDDVQAWLDCNPMSPDYDALAAEEPLLASLIDRESAGI